MGQRFGGHRSPRREPGDCGDVSGWAGPGQMTWCTSGGVDDGLAQQPAVPGLALRGFYATCVASDTSAAGLSGLSGPSLGAAGHDVAGGPLDRSLAFGEPAEGLDQLWFGGPLGPLVEQL